MYLHTDVHTHSSLCLQFVFEVGQLLHVDAATTTYDHQQGAQGSRQPTWNKTDNLLLCPEVLPHYKGS